MNDAPTPLIVFSPSGKRGRFPVGTPVLQAARDLGVDIDSICGGRARCGRCQIEPVEGNFAKENIVSRPDHLSVEGEAEANCRQRGRLQAGNRLSCQAQILGDVRIDVPAASQVHHQVVRKDHEARDIELDPVVHRLATSSSTRSCTCISSRSNSPTSTPPRATCSGCCAPWRTSGGSAACVATWRFCKDFSEPCARATGS
jgi:uncharacterized 2Fe-2S/4Fe-4S cluster protein (DUF4445 family)